MSACVVSPLKDKSSHRNVLFQIAVLHYFHTLDKKTYVMEYTFIKAAKAAFIKMYSITDAYLLI